MATPTDDRPGDWFHVALGVGLIVGLDHAVIGTVYVLFGFWRMMSTGRSTTTLPYDTKPYAVRLQPQIPIGLLLV